MNAEWLLISQSGIFITVTLCNTVIGRLGPEGPDGYDFF